MPWWGRGPLPHLRRTRAGGAGLDEELRVRARGCAEPCQYPVYEANLATWHTKAVRGEPEVDPLTYCSPRRPSRGGSFAGGTPQARLHGRGWARAQRSRARATTCGPTRRGVRTAGPRPAPKSQLVVNLKSKQHDALSKTRKAYRTGS